MKRTILALCLISSAAQANPFADGFADRSCKAIRHAVSVVEPWRVKAPIAVTEVDASDNPTGHFFRCAALRGGEKMRPVEAETSR